MTEKICWCFGYTDDDIVEDIKKHGRSTVLERIVAEKKDGHCDCSHKNPKGK